MAVAWKITRIATDAPETVSPVITVEAEIYNTVTGVRIGKARTYTVNAGVLMVRDEQERCDYIEGRIAEQFSKPLSWLRENPNVEANLALLGSLQRIVGVEHLA